MQTNHPQPKYPIVEPLHAARLLDNLSTSILLIDPSFQMIYINPAAQTLFSISDSRLSDLPIQELFNDHPDTIANLQNVLKTGQPFTKRETTIRTPANTLITIDYTVTPIINENPLSHSPDNEAYHLLIEIQHLDRLRRISREEFLFNSHQTTRSLVKSLAHEVKNPLGGIRGAAQLLEKELQEANHEDLTELQDYFDIIISESDRLQNLVDQMLGPNQLPKLAAVNIHFILERVKQIIDAESLGKITIERDYDTSIPELRADQDQLIQALLNITRNAYQALVEAPDPKTAHHPPKTIIIRTRIDHHITIGHRHHKLILTVSISDNGPGIPQHLKDTLFYPMISGRANGTGLGLSIAQSLINRHQGLIELDSEPSNTTFKIYIPLEQKS